MKVLKFEYTILVMVYALEVNCIPIDIENAPKVDTNEKDLHLKFEHIKKVCSNRMAICKSNDTAVCTTRFFNGTTEYLDFENSCFLFVNNMCENYKNEFSIISSEKCSYYINSRRNIPKKFTQKVTVANSNVTKKNIDVLPMTTVLRSEMSTLYDVDTAFDYHTCPLSCPDVYSPVCVNVNRGHGLYLKFLTFVNHCVADLYYCKHWREFSPPPGEEEIISSSQLSWSLCAANRYIQFARFTEMTSSMGHYGWLAGDHRPTHILEPHERMPGYG